MSPIIDPKKCHICGNTFSKTFALTRHLEGKHGLKKSITNPKTFPCSACDSKFTRADNLKRHLQSKHLTDGDALLPYSSKTYLCEHCPDASFNSKKSVLKHLQLSHSVLKMKSSTQCALCKDVLQNYKQYLHHLMDRHHIAVENEKIVFSSEQDFSQWLDTEKKEKHVNFIVHKRKKNYTLYVCHRSGAHKPRGTGKRFRWKSSIKIGKCCTSRLSVAKLDGVLKVSYFKTHLNHDFSLRAIGLSIEERAQVAGRIKLGVPPKRILDDIRDALLFEDNVERIHLLEKKDIYNIIRDFKLNPGRAHDDDAISTYLWIKSQEKLGEDSPVIFYKGQGVEHPHLKKDDFVLAIMTKYQQALMGSQETFKICIDSTHGTSGYDFQLTSVVTIDEFGAGCPLAMCLSARTDEEVMKIFFTAIKEKVGYIVATEFMSDDAMNFYNAWCSVMAIPERKLLCTWHVDRAWRGKLNKITSLPKRAEVYKGARTLLAMLDEEQFLSAMHNFLVLCKSDGECAEFGFYFEKYYSLRPKEWAYCYRKGAALNTNMFLESMHKKLKYEYLDGKKNRRVDITIKMILQFTRNVMYEAEIRRIKNKPTARMTLVRKSHIAAKKIKPNKIKKETNNVWTVESSSSIGETYIVYLLDEAEDVCIGCPFTCPECHACPHRTSCTCMDSLIRGNVCKHVHAVIATSGRSFERSQVEEIAPAPLLAHPVNINEVVVTPEERAEVLCNTIVGVLPSVNPDAKDFVIKSLDNLLQYCQSQREKQEFKEPANKKAEKQKRFFSVKKNRCKQRQNNMEKPTLSEVKLMSEMLTEETDVPILGTAAGSDHCYFVREK